MSPAFEPANNATPAEWQASTLSRGSWARVSGVIPAGFEAYAAVRHPALWCVCTEESLAAFRSGNLYEFGQPIRWSEVAQSTLPVIYGHASEESDGIAWSSPTQYRRMIDQGWVVDTLSGGDIMPVLRVGDAWIEGPRQGSLEPEIAGTLRRVLDSGTAGSEPCWFGIWDGYGYLSESQRAAPSISTPNRRWHLFRAPLDCMNQSFGFDFEHQSANFLWPGDRSWCLATEIDAEVTYIGGSKELVAAILAEPALETERASPDDRLAWLGDVLKPVVELPLDADLVPGFEAREYPVRSRPPETWWTRLTSVAIHLHRRLTPRGRKHEGKFYARRFRAPWRKKPPGQVQ